MEGVVNFRSSRDNKSVEFSDWSSNTINPDENIIYDKKRLFITLIYYYLLQVDFSQEKSK